MLEVHEAAREAVDRARTGGGPGVIVAETYRMLGHAQHDSQKYMAPEELEEWRGRDPIQRFERVLVDEGWLSESGCEEIRTTVASELAAAVDQVLAEEHPEPDEARTRVFADPEEDPEVPWTRVSPIGYADLNLPEATESRAGLHGGGR